MLNIEDKKEKIKELCKKNNIKLLVLHGSHAQNLAHKNSDIDVGILCNGKPENIGYFKVMGDFQEIFGDKFDPAFLNNAEPMINYHVALKGKLLYEEKKGDFSNYVVESIAKYIDSKKFRDAEKLYIKNAIGTAQCR